MAFNKDQPRIPKGFAGAGRFMKVGQVLAAASDAAHPGGRDRSRGGPRLAKVGGSLSLRSEEQIGRTFSSADTASRVAKVGRDGKQRAAALKDLVRESVARHDGGQGWADLADVRDDLNAAGYTRAEQDQALRAMLQEDRHFRAIPIADQQNLRPRDREAALVTGTDYNVVIRTTPGQFERSDDDPIDTPEFLRADLKARERLLQLDIDAGAPETALTGPRQSIAELRQRIAEMESASAPKPAPRKPGSVSKAAARLAAQHHVQIPRTAAAVPFEDRPEADIEAEVQARRARQRANMEAQRAANGGETDFQRGIRREGAADKRSGEAEIRRVRTALDTEQRTLTVKQREMADVQAQIADAEASGADSGSRYERLLDARDALQQDLEELDARMSPMRGRLEALRRGDAPKTRPGRKRGSLATVGAKLAPQRGQALTGKETKAQLHALAAAEDLRLSKNGSREDLARQLQGLRFERDNPDAGYGRGTRLFADPEADRATEEYRAKRATRPSAPAPRVPRSSTVIVDSVNQDLADKSIAQLRDIAKAEDIEVMSKTRQDLVNEISHIRSMRKRGFHGLFASD